MRGSKPRRTTVGSPTLIKRDLRSIDGDLIDLTEAEFRLLALFSKTPRPLSPAPRSRERSGTRVVAPPGRAPVTDHRHPWWPAALDLTQGRDATACVRQRAWKLVGCLQR
jgi:hypothetical protein